MNKDVGKRERKKKKIKWSCNAPWCHPENVLPAPAFTCPSQHRKWKHLHAHRGLQKFLPARGRAPWWEADRWYLEDREADDEEGNAWARTDHVAPLLSASSCPSSRTTLLSTQELKSFLAATAWRVIPSPNTRHLRCVAQHTGSWSSYFSSIAQLVGTFRPGTHQLVDYFTKTSSGADFYRTTCRSLSTGQHLTFLTVKLSSKWAVPTCRTVIKDHSA